MPNEQIKEIPKLGGLNLRQEPADLADHNLAKVVNLDPYRTPGTLVVRRGRQFVYPFAISIAQKIRQIAKVNSFRYQVASKTLYRDGVSITGEVFDNELETNFSGFRPLNDSAIWAFVADDKIMLKDDGTRTFVWGIDLIPTPAPKVANQTGKDPLDTITEGTYIIAVTQLRFDTSVTV